MILNYATTPFSVANEKQIHLGEAYPVGVSRSCSSCYFYWMLLPLNKFGVGDLSAEEKRGEVEEGVGLGRYKKALETFV